MVMNYLMHHGVQGQKWGIRRYQNPDGTLTAEGKAHAGSMTSKYTLYNTETGADATRKERNYIAAHMKKHDKKLWKTYRTASRTLDSSRADRAYGFYDPTSYVLGNLFSAAVMNKSPAQIAREESEKYAKAVDKVNGMLADYANTKMADIDWSKIKR